MLLRLEAAAATPEGVSAALEHERDAARAALRKVMRELELLRADA